MSGTSSQMRRPTTHAPHPFILSAAKNLHLSLLLFVPRRHPELSRFAGVSAARARRRNPEQREGSAYIFASAALQPAVILSERSESKDPCSCLSYGHVSHLSSRAQSLLLEPVILSRRRRICFSTHTPNLRHFERCIASAMQSRETCFCLCLCFYLLRSSRASPLLRLAKWWQAWDPDDLRTTNDAKSFLTRMQLPHISPPRHGLIPNFRTCHPE